MPVCRWLTRNIYLVLTGTVVDGLSFCLYGDGRVLYVR